MLLFLYKDEFHTVLWVAQHYQIIRVLLRSGLMLNTLKFGEPWISNILISVTGVQMDFLFPRYRSKKKTKHTPLLLTYGHAHAACIDITNIVLGPTLITMKESLLGPQILPSHMVALPVPEPGSYSN